MYFSLHQEGLRLLKTLEKHGTAGLFQRKRALARAHRKGALDAKVVSRKDLSKTKNPFDSILIQTDEET
jgi:hypothetical protein